MQKKFDNEQDDRLELYVEVPKKLYQKMQEEDKALNDLYLFPSGIDINHSRARSYWMECDNEIQIGEEITEWLEAMGIPWQ